MHTSTSSILPYVAGLVDADGCIVMSKQSSGIRSPKLIVTNSDFDLLNWLQNCFGGAVFKKKKYKYYHYQSGDWKLSGIQAVKLMRLILPFMMHGRKIKRADLLVKNIDLFQPHAVSSVLVREKRQKLDKEFMAIETRAKKPKKIKSV